MEQEYLNAFAGEESDTDLILAAGENPNALNSAAAAGIYNMMMA